MDTNNIPTTPPRSTMLLTPANTPTSHTERIGPLLNTAGIHKSIRRPRRRGYETDGYRRSRETGDRIGSPKDTRTRLIQGFRREQLSIGEEALLNAIQLGDKRRVISLLQDGVSPVCQDERGRSPLHWAASYGQASLIKALLDYGAHVNARDINNNSPLHLAVATNRVDCVLMLLQAGATIDTSGSCPSPLEMARSRLLRLLQLRKLRYKATATPMEDGTLDMEQIPERQHTILQIEQIIALLRHFILLKRKSVNQDTEAIDQTSMSLDAITERLKMISVREAQQQNMSTQDPTAMIDTTSEASAPETTSVPDQDAETEQLIQELETMLQQFEIA